MAGYIMGLDDINSLEECICNGTYSTIVSTPKNGIWGRPHEGTFADYATMKPGDHIYFFIDRNIYGIGTLERIKGDCKFKNYPKANNPSGVSKSLLLGANSHNQRWLCTFKPDPFFFKLGVDMDDALASNPLKFKMLRAFWKLSFVKVDDDEDQALRDIIIKYNEPFIANPENRVFPTNHTNSHSKLSKRLTPGHKFDSKDILNICADGDRLRHEMALEAGLLHQLSNRDSATEALFGKMDYLAHQVIASPFKPIDYMDKMDIFGYSYIKGFTTKSKFLVAELKKDCATEDDIDQLMKYVDWVKEEYSYGDYAMINAFLVAYEFPDIVIEQARKDARRTYTIGHRPAQTKHWNNLSLVCYRFDSKNGKIRFTIQWSPENGHIID